MQRERSLIRPLKSRLKTSIKATMASAGESSKSSRAGSRALALSFPNWGADPWDDLHRGSGGLLGSTI